MIDEIVSYPSFIEMDRLLAIIGDIREVFENHFDRTWLAIIIDGLPIDFRTVREIRLLVSIRSIHHGDEYLLFRGVEELEKFILHIKRYLLPDLKERLGVSGLRPDTWVRDKDQFIIRRLVAFTFPYNLERLAYLTEKLKKQLPLCYPSLERA